MGTLLYSGRKSHAKLQTDSIRKKKISENPGIFAGTGSKKRGKIRSGIWELSTPATVDSKYFFMT